MEQDIRELLSNDTYNGVVVKTLAMRKNGFWCNVFTSFTLASEEFLSMNDIDWVIKSGESFPPQSELESHIIEFEKEINNIYIARKHISVSDFMKLLINIEKVNSYIINDREIITDVIFYDNDIYKIGSRTNSIFNTANLHLHRMSDVIIGWSKTDEIENISKISQIDINGVSCSNPIENLMGYYGYETPKELCCSVCVYFPFYKAWLSREKFAEGKRVEVAICTKEKEYIRNLIILYKITKSKETLLFRSFRFESVQLPEIKKGQNLIFYQPIDKDIDTSFMILVDKDFMIQDYSTETHYLRTIEVTMDLLGSKRKHRSAFDVGEKQLDEDMLSKRKALVASLTRETILFSSGDQYAAIQTIHKILNKARTSIIITDPYFGRDNTDWDIFNEIPANIEVLILTNLSDRDATSNSDFLAKLKNLRKEISKINAQNINYKNQRGKDICPFHDRYFIIDKRYVWMLGTSINGLGKRDSSIIYLDKDESSDIVNKIEYYLSASPPIQKMFAGNTWNDVPITINNL